MITHSESPVDPKRQALVLAALEDGVKPAGLASSSQSPVEIVHAVDDYVFQWQQGRLAKGKQMDLEDAPFGLGTLWGQQLVRAFEWHWGTITFHAHQDSHALCVISKDASLIVAPIHYVMGCLKNRGVDVCIELAFNMLKAGKVRGPKPGDYMNLMEGVRHIVAAGLRGIAFVTGCFSAASC